MSPIMQQQYQSSLVLANAAEIISGVVREIAGNDISNSLNGSRITSEIVQTLAIQRMYSGLRKPIS